MIITGLDIETTGLSAPDGHKTIEVCAQLWRLEEGVWQRKINYVQRINPMRSIQADAQRVHGIQLSDLSACPEFIAVAPTMLKVIERGDYVVAHNGEFFDGPFLNYELKANGLPKITKPFFDTMTNARWATANGKSPTLGELCFACDIPYDPSKAHAADYDVDVMMQACFRGLEWGYFDLSNSKVIN